MSTEKIMECAPERSQVQRSVAAGECLLDIIKSLEQMPVARGREVKRLLLTMLSISAAMIVNHSDLFSMANFHRRAPSVAAYP